MKDMKILHTIRDVPSNIDGLCALSSNENSPYLAYPGSSITGEIQIFDTVNLVCSILKILIFLEFLFYIETRNYDKCS